MFIIPAIQQSALGLDDDSLLGTMHLNALNGSSDVLGSSGTSGAYFRGPMTTGATSPPAISSSALSTPGCNGMGVRGRGQRRMEVFGGLFGACVSDNHPYRPQDSGTAYLFREESSKTPTAAAVVSAGLATAGTTQFVNSDALSATMDHAAGISAYGGAGKGKYRKGGGGDRHGRSHKDAQTTHHHTKSYHHVVKDSDNAECNNTVSYTHDKNCCSKNTSPKQSYKTEAEGQYLRSYSSCPSPSFPPTMSYENELKRLRYSELAFLAKETERKRRGKHNGPRRHSLDLDLALLSASLASSSSGRKEHRARSACRGRNSIPSDNELSRRSSKSSCRCYHGDGDSDLEVDVQTLSITEVDISTDTAAPTPPAGRRTRDSADGGGQESRSAHAHRKHRRAYTTDSATSARAMKLLEKVKDKKTSIHESGHSKGSSKYHPHHHYHQQQQQQQQQQQLYHNLCEDDAEENNHRHGHGHKSGHHSRPGSGMLRHHMARHLSENVMQQKTQMTSEPAAPPPGADADAKKIKSRGKLLSRFSLE